jgi:L-2-hydroxyglutarate oxidase LhgO
LEVSNIQQRSVYCHPGIWPCSSMKSGVVVGGGIIGISIARKLAKLGADVILCEKSRHLFMETSSRNSGVIHAGLYYPKDSKMAFHCVRGKLMLYDYLRGRNLPHEQCGKLVVASSENDLCILEALHKKGIANGVLDLRMVSGAEIRGMEPACSSTVGALLSPSTGIVDQHALCESLLVEAEEAGAIIALETDVTRIETTSSSSFIVHSSDKGDIAADFVVNELCTSRKARTGSSLKSQKRSTVSFVVRSMG